MIEGICPNCNKVRKFFEITIHGQIEFFCNECAEGYLPDEIKVTYSHDPKYPRCPKCHVEYKDLYKFYVGHDLFGGNNNPEPREGAVSLPIDSSYYDKNTLIRSERIKTDNILADVECHNCAHKVILRREKIDTEDIEYYFI